MAVKKTISKNSITKANKNSKTSSDLQEQVPEPVSESAQKQPTKCQGYRFIRVPNNRRNQLKKNWTELCTPIIDQMKLQIKMNLQKRQIELRTSIHTTEDSALQKGEDFIRAFLIGFEIKDAISLLRLDDIYLDSFMVTDVRKLPRGHLSRAIGRIVGKNGKTKFTIENATQTRIVIADQHVHILGLFKNIRVARATLVRLIVGAQPGKVYSQMQLVAARNKCRY